MTKTDKQFITQLINGLERKIDWKIDNKVDGLRDQLMAEIRLNTDEIRYNGILIEQNKHEIDLLSEGHAVFSRQIGELQEDMASVKEKTDLIPAIYTTVQNHSRRLLALEKR